jgi:hypothetical protein
MYTIIARTKIPNPMVWKELAIRSRLDTKSETKDTFKFCDIINDPKFEMKKRKTVNTNEAVSIVIKKDDIFYVICNYHTVKNSYIVKCIINGNEVILEKVNDYYAFDLSVFKFNTSQSITRYYKYEELDTRLPKEFSKLCYVNNNETKILCNSHDTKIEDGKIFSNLLPALPLITTKISKKLDKYNGLSGAVFVNNNKICGIISNIDIQTNVLFILPNYLIKGIINNPDKLVYMPFTYKNEIKDFKETKLNNFNILIENDYNIKWINENKKIFKFKNKTILAIDENIIVPDEKNNKICKVWYDDIGYNININFYSTIKYLLNPNIFSLAIKYQTNIKIKTFTKIINYQYLDSLLQINFEYNYQFCKIDNLIIIEFSDDIIKELSRMKIPVSDNLLNIINNPFTGKSNQKLLLVIDNLKDNKGLYNIVNSINNKKIKNMNQIIELSKSKPITCISI